MSADHPLDRLDQRERADAPPRFMPAVPSAKTAPRLIVGVPLSGSAWVDLFQWYSSVKPSDLSDAISLVLDEIAWLEHDTGACLGSEWTHSAIDAVWCAVRTLPGRSRQRREAGDAL